MFLDAWRLVEAFQAVWMYVLCFAGSGRCLVMFDVKVLRGCRLVEIQYFGEGVYGSVIEWKLLARGT